MLSMRPFRDADMPVALALCRAAGWNQTAEDWRRMQQAAGEGLLVAEWDGAPCATASAVAYGRELGWIGMMLVHPDYRRRGIATALMEACLARLQAAGVHCVGLDATEAGQPVYERLGFVASEPIWRLEGSGLENAGAQPPVPGERDLAAAWRLDRRATGCDRSALLRLMARDGRVCKEGSAFGCARRGHVADQVGPVIAEGVDNARRVIHTLLTQCTEKVYWDLLPSHADALQLSDDFGFTLRRRLVRMFLGEDIPHYDASLVYATAGFEWG